MEERSSKGGRQHGRSGGLRASPKTAEGLTPLPSWTDGKTGFAWGYATNKDHGTRLDTGLYWKMTPTHSSLPTLLRSPYPTPNTSTQIPTASALLTKPGCLGRCGSHQCPRVGDAVWCFDGCRVASRSAAFIAPSKAMEEPTAMPRTPPPEKNGDENRYPSEATNKKAWIPPKIDSNLETKRILKGPLPWFVREDTTKFGQLKWFYDCILLYIYINTIREKWSCNSNLRDCPENFHRPTATWV